MGFPVSFGPAGFDNKGRVPIPKPTRPRFRTSQARECSEQPDWPPTDQAFASVSSGPSDQCNLRQRGRGYLRHRRARDSNRTLQQGLTEHTGHSALLTPHFSSNHSCIRSRSVVSSRQERRSSEGVAVPVRTPVGGSRSAFARNPGPDDCAFACTPPAVDSQVAAGTLGPKTIRGTAEG